MASDLKGTAADDIRRRLAAGETSSAIAEVNLRIRQGAVGPDMFRLLALAHLKANQAKEAKAALARARESGTDAENEIAFGRFMNREGHKEAALDCFLAALEIDGDNGDALALVCMH